MPSLEPVSRAPVASLEIARRAIRSRRPPASADRESVSALEDDLANGRALGVLRRDGDRCVGIAIWELPSPLGATLELVFLDDGASSPAAYLDFFREISGIAGPIAFSPGGLAGLSDVEESNVMRGIGFAPFARFEMRFPSDAPLPEIADDALPPSRPTRSTDLASLAELHARAYGGQFDRYLFLNDPDPRRDADLAVRDIVGGRWGEFLPWASPVAEADGHLVGASLVVRATGGPLIADVMVDPASQGRGIGRTVLAESVRALREVGESAIVLNVTDGNERARRLYERLGFVRTSASAYAWYSTERIPVGPGAGEEARS
jgi:ribosomal protein S18 acetylase RimI-like enzyme